MCYLGIIFIINNDLKVGVSLRIQKFTAAVCTFLRKRIIGFENVYINVMVTKCMPILFYEIDCLHLDCYALKRLSVVWNVAYRWIYCIPRHEHMRTYVRNCNTMSFKFLINQKLVCFVCNLNAGKSCLLSKLTAWYITGDELTRVADETLSAETETRPRLYKT